MPNRFCAQCGAKLPTGDANFCVECGERQPGARVAPPRTLALQSYAPVLVILAVIAVGGAAVGLGLLSPKTPPAVPPRGNATAAPAAGIFRPTIRPSRSPSR